MKELIRALLPWVALYLVFSLIVAAAVAMVVSGVVGIIEDLPKGWNPC